MRREDGHLHVLKHDAHDPLLLVGVAFLRAHRVSRSTNGPNLHVMPPFTSQCNSQHGQTPRTLKISNSQRSSASCPLLSASLSSMEFTQPIVAVPPWFARHCRVIAKKKRHHFSLIRTCIAIGADLELFLQERGKVARRLTALAPVAIVVLAGIFPISKSLRRRVICT